MYHSLCRLTLQGADKWLQLGWIEGVGVLLLLHCLPFFNLILWYAHTWLCHTTRLLCSIWLNLVNRINTSSVRVTDATHACYDRRHHSGHCHKHNDASDGGFCITCINTITWWLLGAHLCTYHTWITMCLLHNTHTREWDHLIRDRYVRIDCTHQLGGQHRDVW